MDKPTAPSEGTRKSMRANRSKGTSPEVALTKALWASGIRGYRKNVLKLPGKPDVVFAKRKLCVFVHGCFWHGCPECGQKRNIRPTANGDYWREKMERNRLRDERNVALLERDGWRVVVVWECEIKRDLPAIVQKLTQSLA
jgi:DNA mismatch endonuclease (patch repair protein)